jgi:hypothetical protein
VRATPIKKKYLAGASGRRFIAGFAKTLITSRPNGGLGGCGDILKRTKFFDAPTTSLQPTPDQHAWRRAFALRLKLWANG